MSAILAPDRAPYSALDTIRAAISGNLQPQSGNSPEIDLGSMDLSSTPNRGLRASVGHLFRDASDLVARFTEDRKIKDSLRLADQSLREDAHDPAELLRAVEARRDQLASRLPSEISSQLRSLTETSACHLLPTASTSDQEFARQRFLSTRSFAASIQEITGGASETDRTAKLFRAYAVAAWELAINVIRDERAKSEPERLKVRDAIRRTFAALKEEDPKTFEG